MYVYWIKRVYNISVFYIRFRAVIYNNPAFLEFWNYVFFTSLDQPDLSSFDT